MTNPLQGLDSKTLFDAAADAMLLVDAKGNILLANRALRQMLGYRDDDSIIGDTVESLIPERHRERHHQHRQHYAAAPAQRAMGNGNNLVVLSKDGRELPVYIGLSPINDHGRQLVLTTFHFPDHDQLSRKALWESEERLRLAKSAAGLGVFDFDLLSQTALCDERIREIWGLSENETVTYGQLADGLHPQDLAIRNAAMQRALDPDGGGEYQVEYRVINKIDRSEHWVSTTGRVFFSNNVAIRLVGVVQDISRQKALERELRRQRIEMEFLIKKQMAAQTASAIAHELNQPLAAISAYSEVALRSMSSNLPDTSNLIRALEGCFTQAQRAGNSLHELLSSLHESELKLEAIDMNHLVQEAVSTVKSDAYYDFNIILDMEEHLPPIMANHTQVKKVLLNLLYNGAKAMRDARISPASIYLQARIMKERHCVQVSIRDEGPGIKPEIANRLFEPFFSTKKNGMGMGLIVSRTLIESMGGQLWINPEEKPGATFHFSLPLAL